MERSSFSLFSGNEFLRFSSTIFFLYLITFSIKNPRKLEKPYNTHKGNLERIFRASILIYCLLSCNNFLFVFCAIIGKVRKTCDKTRKSNAVKKNRLPFRDELNAYSNVFPNTSDFLVKSVHLSACSIGNETHPFIGLSGAYK